MGGRGEVLGAVEGGGKDFRAFEGGDVTEAGAGEDCIAGEVSGEGVGFGALIGGFGVEEGSEVGSGEGVVDEWGGFAGELG